jgi:hypothetical protein
MVRMAEAGPENPSLRTEKRIQFQQEEYRNVLPRRSLDIEGTDYADDRSHLGIGDASAAQRQAASLRGITSLLRAAGARLSS